ncbi:adipocyte plasma membrane-associated protein Hemomucin isoform X1 [Drosophila takahashii]|uniref:adipocyte plasma membrane-associated protein Hemomucin isoform X1 n=1 Tax=Drosophila takahashii TaxID=29030 RepID=UPI001CF80C79|nr:adipocyte plasma membrane-associated protein [Drosophila takahashii]
MGFLGALLKTIIILCIFLGALILLPGLPPSTTFPFKEYVIKPPRELNGVLQTNFHLDKAKQLWKDRIFGPECLLVFEEKIYTGIHSGEVIGLSNEETIQPITKIGQPCDYIFDDELCGYPVGLALDTQGKNLIVADSYYGVWQVNLATKAKTRLVSKEQILPGKKVNRRAKLFNSLAVSRQGEIYWTDSLSDDFVLAPFANPSGRLFRYNREKKTNEVLLDELAFANGLALSPGEDFIIVAETTAMRLTKYYLKGSRAGQSEVFVDGLPGWPDNLTSDSEGIWVPLSVASDSENPNLFASLAPYPRLRSILARLVGLMQLPFRISNYIYPNDIAARLFHSFNEMATNAAPNRSTVVRVDWKGNIVRSLHGFDRSASGISHVLEIKGDLYLGSPFNQYIAKVKLPDYVAKSVKETKTNEDQLI